jgi:hypothetical protein
MRNSLKITSVAAGMVLAGAVGASAAVIEYDVNTAVTSGGEVTEFPNAAPLVREFTFEEDGNNGPFFGYLDIEVGRQFSLSLEDYQPSFSGAAQSFFSILNLDTNNFVTMASTCASTIAAIDGYSCNPVNGDEGSAGNPPPITFSALDAGKYRVSVFESGDPVTVQFDFRVSAVPLPAAGWLMIAGLGGLAALRRRKKS